MKKGWKYVDWKTVRGGCLKDVDLWKNLDFWMNLFAFYEIPIDVQWVKGHSGDPDNDAADTIAKRAAVIAKKKDPMLWEDAHRRLRMRF